MPDPDVGQKSDQIRRRPPDSRSDQLGKFLEIDIPVRLLKLRRDTKEFAQPRI